MWFQNRDWHLHDSKSGVLNWWQNSALPYPCLEMLLITNADKFAYIDVRSTNFSVKKPPTIISELINGCFFCTVFLFENTHKSKRQGPKKQSCIPMVNCFTPAVRSWKYWGVLIPYVVIHMHGSFFPDVGPLACVEIPSLRVADCKPGAACRSSISVMEMIQGANDTCG